MGELAAGATVSITIEGLGTLVNPVVNETDIYPETQLTFHLPPVKLLL